MEKSFKVGLLFVTYCVVAHAGSAQKVEKRGDFMVHITHHSKSEYEGRVKYDSISIVDPVGNMTDYLVFQSYSGNEFNSATSKLGWLSNSKFEIRQVKISHKDPVTLDDDPATGVDEEVLFYHDDPYEILGYALSEEKVAFYELAESGKIIKSDSVSQKTIRSGLYNFETFNHFPKAKLRVLRNAIFARYGYKFKSQDLLDYFSQKDWYDPKFDNVAHLLTGNDKQVIDYIVKLEKK